VRSEYSSQASLASARTLVVDGGWWGPGWYWNPYWGMYSFVPGGPLFSPFGWGFYSPRAFYGGGLGYGFRSYARPAYRGPVGHAIVPHAAFHGGGGGGHRR
jgi:hypothetical protein